MLAVSYEAGGQRPSFFKYQQTAGNCSVTAPLKRVIAEEKMYFFHLLLQLVCWFERCVGLYLVLAKAFSSWVSFKICSSRAT